MPLTGFDAFNKTIEKFEKAKLFSKFGDFLMELSMTNLHAPMSSKMLEHLLKIKGSEIRNLAGHARDKGYLVGSDERGYFIAKNAWELQGTLKHLRERANIINRRADRLEQSAAKGGKKISTEPILNLG